jgi:uncharacterized protein YecT (DUF1311 family)
LVTINKAVQKIYHDIDLHIRLDGKRVYITLLNKARIWIDFHSRENALMYFNMHDSYAAYEHKQMLEYEVQKNKDRPMDDWDSPIEFLS